MKILVLFLIRVYQKSALIRKPFLRVIIGTDKTCRYNPTCSEYTYQAVNKYGAGKGLWLGFKRIIKCNPLSSK